MMRYHVSVCGNVFHGRAAIKTEQRLGVKWKRFAADEYPFREIRVLYQQRRINYIPRQVE
jgi:hypothetical protein